MTAIESLQIDFQAEINQSGFGNTQWEEDSYQYMINTIESSKVAKTIKEKLLELLDDTSISLQQAYFNVLDFLEQMQ